MENSVWRPRARIVAVADMYLSSVYLAVNVIVSVVIFKEIFSELPKSDPVIFWLVVGAISLVFGIQIWAASMLLGATDKDLNDQEALKGAKIYLCLTTVILILIVGVQIFFGLYISLVVVLVIRVVFLFVAHKFVKTLQRVIQDKQEDRIPIINI